jgi:hypothetical protein
MLLDFAQRAVELARDPATTAEQLKSAFSTVAAQMPSATAEEAAQTVAVLGRGLDEVADDARARTLAMFAGAMIEHGADPAGLIDPLIARLSRAAPAARCFAEAVENAVPPNALDRPEKLDAERSRLAASMPGESAAWAAIQSLYPPAIAAFTASPAGREKGRGVLLSDMAALAGCHHEGGHWILKMLQVLDRERYVAIDPDARVGIAGRMSGIVDNFQLHVLLMDAFPRRRWFASRRVSDSAVKVARGDGPQETGETITGAWNLYTWHALRPDGSLPEKKDWGAGWIWGEGTPLDIPPLDGTRVILLGPPSYVRTWNSQRAFVGLRAELTFERGLGQREVREWKARIVEANRAQEKR